MEKKEKTVSSTECFETKEPTKLLYNPSYDNMVIQELMMGAMAITLDTISKVQISIKTCIKNNPQWTRQAPAPIFEKEYEVEDENGNTKKMSVKELAAEAFHDIISLINKRVDNEEFLNYIEAANVFVDEIYVPEHDDVENVPRYKSFKELLTKDCTSEYEEAFRFMEAVYGLHVYDVYKYSETVLTNKQWNIGDCPMHIETMHSKNHRALLLDDEYDIDYLAFARPYKCEMIKYSFYGLISFLIGSGEHRSSDTLTDLIHSELSMCITKQTHHWLNDRGDSLFDNNHINTGTITLLCNKIKNIAAIITESTMMNLMRRVDIREDVINNPRNKWGEHTNMVINMFKFITCVVDTPEAFAGWTDSGITVETHQIIELLKHAPTYVSIVGMLQYGISVYAVDQPREIRTFAIELVKASLRSGLDTSNYVWDVIRCCVIDAKLPLLIAKQPPKGPSIHRLYSQLNKISKVCRPTLMYGSRYMFTLPYRIVELLQLLQNKCLIGFDREHASVMIYEVLLILAHGLPIDLNTQDLENLTELISVGVYTNSPLFHNIAYAILGKTENDISYRAGFLTVNSRNAHIEASSIHFMYMCEPELYARVLLWVSNLSLLNANKVICSIIKEQENGRTIRIQELIEKYDASKLVQRDATVIIP